MARSKEYLALKNFFHNTMQLDRAQLRGIVKEVVCELAKDEIQRFMLTGKFTDIAHKAIYWGMGNVRDDIGRFILNELIATRVAYEKRCAEEAAKREKKT